MTEQRAAIYSRVSTASQAEEDKTSLSEQTADMEAYCERHGYEIVERYQDVGSGQKKDRAQFQRMLADARQGRFDTIVCWKSDRLSRGMYPAAALMEVVEAHQIRLEAVMDAIDMKTFGLMAAIGKIELDNIRERTAMGKRGQARQGKIPAGKLPYGYQRDGDGRPEVNEAEAEAVKALFVMYVNEQKSVPVIREILERAYNWKLSEGHIHNVLSFEPYIGAPMSYEGIQIAAPSIIDQTIFKKAQLRKRNRLVRAPADRPKPYYLLDGMFRCAGCGKRLLARTRRDSGSTKRYYRCSAYAKTCREHPYIAADGLEARVWREVREVLDRPDLLSGKFNDLDNGGLTEEIKAAKRELAQWETEQGRILTVYQKGIITEELLTKQMKFLQEPLEAAKERLEGLQRQQKQDDASAAVLERFMSFVARHRNHLDGLDDSGKAKTLRDVIANATLDSNNVPRYGFLVPDEPVIFASTAEEDAYRSTKSTPSAKEA